MAGKHRPPISCRFHISAFLDRGTESQNGVDNWLFPKCDDYTPIDFAQNYLYQTLATNMRGFHQNITRHTLTGSCSKKE